MKKPQRCGDWEEDDGLIQSNCFVFYRCEKGFALFNPKLSRVAATRPHRTHTLRASRKTLLGSPHRTFRIVTMAASAMASNSLAGARGSYAAPKSRATLGRKVAMSTRKAASSAVTVRAAKTPDGPKVAIAGISGAVGQEFIRVRDAPRRLFSLHSSYRIFPVASLGAQKDIDVFPRANFFCVHFFAFHAQRQQGREMVARSSPSLDPISPISPPPCISPVTFRCSPSATFLTAR